MSTMTESLAKVAVTVGEHEMTATPLDRRVHP